jgi:hypothetical protein
MKSHDTDITARTGKFRKRARVARWGVRITMVACGSLIATIIASEPRVMAQIERGTQVWADMLASNQQVAAVAEPESEALPVATPSSQEAQKPAAIRVNVMPTSRIPVRRLGETSD